MAGFCLACSMKKDHIDQLQAAYHEAAKIKPVAKAVLTMKAIQKEQSRLSNKITSCSCKET